METVRLKAELLRGPGDAVTVTLEEGLTMEKRELICIGCPMGCPLTVTLDGGAVVTVQGNTCPRGDAYARREVTAPTRIVTTTVRVTGGTLPAVSCKTRSDIPKEKIFDVVRALKSVVVPAPVHIGQILLPDAAGTGVDVVATKDVAEVWVHPVMKITFQKVKFSKKFGQKSMACLNIAQRNRSFFGFSTIF